MHSLITHSSSSPAAPPNTLTSTITLSSRQKITLLNVKSIPNTYSIRAIFAFARSVAPCLLIIEDIDTQITPDKLSYFFNEVDGLENNNGILMIATTNHLDKLDEGLKRPSRFDRRYLFPLPEKKERELYCEFWRGKLKRKGAKVVFPRGLVGRMAGIMGGFSFATMKEAFVATLLALARRGDEEGRDGEEENDVNGADKGGDGDGGNLDDLPLWKEFQVQVKLLRKEMEKQAMAIVAPMPMPTSHALRPFGALNNVPPPPPRHRNPYAPHESPEHLHATHQPPSLSQLDSPHLPSNAPAGAQHFDFLRKNGYIPAFPPPPPPPVPTNTSQARMPVSLAMRSLMTGPDPPFAPGNCLVPKVEFLNLYGEGNVNSRGPSAPGQ